ncbi:MAG: hypothetical protein D6729_17190, partial [Deltaproteobacteria bacterium]
MARAAFALLLATLCACAVRVDRQQEGFPCNEDGGCLLGLVCVAGVCVRRAPDAGVGDAGLPDGGGDDGGAPDGGAPCSVPAFGCPCEDGTEVACAELSSPEQVGVGVCTAGVRRCVHGRFGPCLWEVGPAREICNGADDDCDGLTDEPEDLPQAVECEQRGVCAGATRPSCGAECDYGPDYLPGELASCQGGQTAADGLDNDCDGEIDEGCGSCEPGAACYGLGLDHPTLGVGRCRAGSLDCQDPERPRCAGAITPEPERCNGWDDDCDGLTDEDDPQVGTACMTGRAGLCAEGRWRCREGSLVCQPLHAPLVDPALPEVLCDGVDEDCDGEADDGLDVPGAALNCETLSCCGGACVDLETSAEHCGACGSPCDNEGNPCLAAQCIGGVCERRAQPDGTACGANEVCIDGSCVRGCHVSGVWYREGYVSEECYLCDPDRAADAFVPRPDGTPCGSASVCIDALCEPGCFFEGAYFQPGQPLG